MKRYSPLISAIYLFLTTNCYSAPLTINCIYNNEIGQLISITNSLGTEKHFWYDPAETWLNGNRGRFYLILDRVI